MPAKILGTAVKNHIRTQQQWFLKIRGEEGVVHDQHQVVCTAQPGNSRNIGYMHHRIGGRFNKNCPCLRLYSFPDVINVGSVDKIKGKPVLSGNMPEQPMRASIDVIGGNYMIPGGKELHQCCNSSHPGRESNGVETALQFCHRLLQVLPRRVLGPGVIKTCT